MTFVTAGYPTKDATVPILLAMEEGGADVLELGVPFSDPIADGPVIQVANTVNLYALFPCPASAHSRPISQIAVNNNVDYSDCLNIVRDARKQGLKAPVVLMGMAIQYILPEKSNCPDFQDTITLCLRMARKRRFRMQKMLGHKGSSWWTFPQRKQSAFARSVLKSGAHNEL